MRENLLYYGLFYPNDLFHVKHGNRSSILFHVKRNVVNWLCFTKKCSELALFHVKQRSNERIAFKNIRSSGNNEENQSFHVKHWVRRLVRIICRRKCLKQAMCWNRSRLNTHPSECECSMGTWSDCFCQLFEKKDQLFHVKRKKGENPT